MGLTFFEENEENFDFAVSKLEDSNKDKISVNISLQRNYYSFR
jgi:hypothetical protein